MDKMNVEYMDYHDQDGNRIVFGMNVSDDGKKTPVINLFDIDENKENPSLGRNIMAITKHILSEVLGSRYKTRSDVKWTMTTGFRSTDIDFEDLPNSTLNIHLSDSKVFDWEQTNPFSMDRYNNEYSKQSNGRPVHKEELGQRIKELDYPKVPKTYNAVPCEKASEGVFYCKPTFENLPDSYETVLVDVKKLLDRLENDDPDLIRHAEREFRGKESERWLNNNSLDNPVAFGSYALDVTTGKFTMDSGHAPLLKVLQELDMPCIPISVAKQGNWQQLLNDIRYDEQTIHPKHDQKLKL